MEDKNIEIKVEEDIIEERGNIYSDMVCELEAIRVSREVKKIV